MTNEQIVFDTAIENGMPNALALLIVAQSKHESNDYTSDIFTHCNNSFGYKTGGYVTGCAYNPDYRPYTNVSESTKEICLWIKRRESEGVFPQLYEITTAAQYAQLLKDAGYYGDTVSNYTAGLIRWFKTNISVVTGSGILIAALFFF